MPQMGQMPSGAPSQMGLGALAMRQGPQMDPRMMQMMQRLQGGVPQPAQQTGGGIERVSLDRSIPRPVGSGGMPAGGPSQAEMQYQQFLQQTQMPPGMAAPGGAQFSAMNFTPRPATMGLDGMPIQRANDPQMLAQMQAFQRQGAQVGMPGGMPMPKMPGMIDSGGMPGGVPVQRPMPFGPMPVGAGGKGTGMPPPGMVNPPRPMPLPPGLNRPMPMPMPPGNMVNPPRPMVQNPRAQAAQSANPLLAQMMRGGSR